MSASDTQVESFREETRNKLKRTRAEEDISSGTTISNSEYEPRKKRRKGCTGLCCPSSYITDITLKTIYKNPKFSSSRESVPNVIAPPWSSLSFDSILFNQMLHNTYSGLSTCSQVSNTSSSENNARVVMVTGPDGNKTEIFMRKAVMMHVRETPARREHSLTDVKDNIHRISEETSSSRDSDGEFHTWHGLQNRNFIHHVSSLEILRLKSSRKLTNVRSKRSRQTKAHASSIQARPNCVNGNHCFATEERSPQCPSTSKVDDTPPQDKDMDDIDSLQKQTKIGDHPDAVVEVASQDRQIKLPKRNHPPVANPSTLLSRSNSVLQPSVYSKNNIKRDESNNDVVPCALLVCLCFLLSRLMNVIY